MSAQSGKKRRLGSRRHGVNQSETSQPDELKDSTSVAQPNIPEENTESLNVLSNPDYSQLETKHPPSPELTGHKRKLGSSRRNKGRQHVKDPVTEQNDKPREEMEKNTSDDTLETTQMSLAIQPEKQTALCQGNEQDVTHNTHSSEGQNPSISEVDVENLIPENENLQANYSQTEIDSKLVSDSWKLVEITLGRTDKSDTHECAEVGNQVEENAHCVGITDVNSSSLHLSPTVDQQPTDESNTEEMTGEELHSVYSATHSENKEGDGDAELLRQDGNLQSNCLVSYSYEKSEDMEFSTTAEITTEKSSQKETFSSPDRKLAPNKEHSEHFNLSEVKDAQYSDDSVNKEDKQKVRDAQHLEEAIYEGHEREVTATQMQEMQQSGYSSESVIHDVKEKMDTSSENLIDRAEIIDIYQSEVSADESATKQEVSNPDDKQDEHPIKESNIGALDQRDEDDHVEEETDTGFNPIGNRRKLGSSRRNKGRRHIKDPVAESYHEVTEEMIENEPETTVEEKSVETMLEEMDKLDTSQTEEVSDQIKEDAHVSTLVSISEFTGSSLHPSSTVDQQITDQSNSTEMPNEELPDVYSITDTENKEENEDKELCQHGNLQGNYLVSESDIKSEDMEFSTTLEVTSDKTSTMENIESEYIDEQTTFSSPTEELSTSEEQNEHFNSSEVKDAQHSQDSVNKENKQEVTATQMQEMQQSGYSSESVIHDVKEKMDTSSENLIDRAEIRDIYQSEVSADESATKQEVSNPDEKQDEHPIKESNIGALDQINEDDHISNTKEPWISNIAPRQVYEGEDQEEEDIKPSAEETVHQVKDEMLSEVEECESSSQTQQGEINAPLNSQPQHESVNIEEQTDTGFNPIGNRRKLGSSRRSKGRRHIKDPVAESYHEATEEIIENEPETTVEEKSVETMLEEMDKLDTSQTEEVSDQIKEDAHVSTLVSISEFTGSSLHPSSTVDQQITDQSNSTEMPNEELADVYSITDTENKEENEDKELCRHGNLQGNYLVSESDIKSEDMEFLTTPEVTSDKTSTMENIESEYIDEQASFSSPTEELSTSEEQNEHFNSSEVKDAQHSHDSVNKENKQEVTATQMPEIQQSGYSSESVIHDVKEKMDTSSENLIDRAEIRDIYQSEVSADESATKQEVSNPDEKQDEHPIKESNIGALDQIDEDDHISNTKEPWISNIAPCQAYEGEDQEEEDIKAEETVHQVKKEMPSEVEECESSSQTQQGEINALLNSQPQHESVNIEEQTDTGFNPIGNRRKLGSSRRSKGRRHIKDPVAESYHEVTEEIIENEPETTVEEKSVETMLEEMDELDTSQTEEVSDQIKEDAHDMPNEDRANTENKERDEGTELLGQHGHLYSKYLVSESDVSTTEITVEKSSLGKSSVEKEAFSSLDGKLSTNKEQSEHFILVEVRGAQQSEEAVNKLHEQEVKPTQIHKMDQIDHSSAKEDKSLIHTLQSGMQSLLVSQPQDDSVSIQAQTHTGHTVNRRKMGSSRRHKERQLVKDSDSDMEPKEVIVNSRGGEMSSATETTPQEELTDRGLKQDEKRQVCSTVKEKSNTEKMQEEDTVLSENVLDNNAIVTTDITSSSDKDDSVKSNKEVSEKEKKQTEKPLVKIDSPKVSVWKEDSDIQSISYQGNNVSTGSSTLDVLNQEEAFQVQNLEAISSDEKLLTNNMMETSTENSGISNADDAHTSQQETQENSDDSENVQIKSKQKKRKMGSTRRTLNRKQEGGIDNKDETEESNLNAESDIRNLNKVEQEAEVPSIVTTDVSQNENGKLSLSTMQQKPQEMKEVSTVQEQERAVYSSTDSNMITGIDDLMAFLPEQPTSFTEEVVNAVKCFQVHDVTNTETFCGTTESDEDVNEGPHNANFEMKNASPNLNLTNRKRRMGSSRRNLGTISKREDLHQKQVVDNEATETNVKDVMTEHGIKEKELQLQKEHNDGDSEPGKEKVFETVERSRTGDSYAKPPGHQTAEENPVANQQVDTEHHLTPDVIPVKPATSPEYDAMSESPHAGRRRKMGSHRKSHGHQTSRKDKIIDTETGRCVRTITGESGMKTLEEHREESLGLDKKSEVIESDKKTSSNISITKTGEHSRPVSEKTPVRLGQESQKHLSLADNSNSYNVVMVGDSSVGKTSFMKRARSGKFSFDLPASVGLDSCLWTVLVEGKPVVLQLWDTAGQERFHSITRQIFHKAHAFLLMYDITSSQSFSAVRYWVNCIKDGAMEDVTILLLGNKSDCAERQVPTQQGEILAKEHNFDFMECSAATGENVVQSLEVVARLLSQKVNTGKEAVVLHKEPKQKTTSGCC